MTDPTVSLGTTSPPKYDSPFEQSARLLWLDVLRGTPLLFDVVISRSCEELLQGECLGVYVGARMNWSQAEVPF